MSHLHFNPWFLTKKLPKGYSNVNAFHLLRSLTIFTFTICVKCLNKKSHENHE